MPFVPLGEMYPEIAPYETRSIKIIDDNELVPKGDYGYIEMFCDEPNCNCRRTIIRVMNDKGESMALIGFGWGTKAQYRKWFGSPMPNSMYKGMRGPCHHDGTMPSKYAEYFLDFFKNILMKDKNYIERIKKHYRMVRKYIIS